MAVTINASTSTGLVQSADTSGVIELQTNGTTVATVNTSNNMQFRSAISVGNATPTTSGAGITFPATQSASTDANTLDDYEEGTWTFQFFDAASGGTGSATTATGYYTKIGNMVYCHLTDYSNMTTSGMTAGNEINFTLPFTPASGNAGESVGTLLANSFDYPSGSSLVPITFGGTARGQFYAQGDNIGINSFKVSGISSGTSDLNRFFIAYRTA